MGKWINALRGKEFTQDKGQLKSIEGYCCLGVKYEIEGYKPTWHPFYNSYVFEGGMDVLPNSDTARSWGIKEIVTEGEIEKVISIVDKYDDIEQYYNFLGNCYTRQDVLAKLNDDTNIGFEGIAEVLEVLGWDKSEGEDA